MNKELVPQALEQMIRVNCMARTLEYYMESVWVLAIRNL